MDKGKTIEEKIAAADFIKNVKVTFVNEPNYQLMAKAIMNYIEDEDR
jgi:hypothetical protein